MGGHPATRHMGHQGPPHFGGPSGPSHGGVVPLYQPLTPAAGPSGVKRPRPDDLDLSVTGLPGLEQEDMEQMQQTPIGTGYAQAAPGPPPTHHHHRLPDTGPPSKMMRRDDGTSAGGGAPSVVGQPGMPEPAPQPRGPKLKFTHEDDQLLVDLKENKSLTWKQIADFFPGRSSGTLQVRYCTKLKAKTTQWTDETVRSYCQSRISPTRILDGPFGRIANDHHTVGSEAAHCTGGVRKREVEDSRKQSRHWFHASSLSRSSHGAHRGPSFIATSVPPRSFGS